MAWFQVKIEIKVIVFDVLDGSWCFVVTISFPGIVANEGL